MTWDEDLFRESTDNKDRFLIIFLFFLKLDLLNGGLPHLDFVTVGCSKRNATKSLKAPGGIAILLVGPVLSQVLNWERWRLLWKIGFLSFRRTKTGRKMTWLDKLKDGMHWLKDVRRDSLWLKDIRRHSGWFNGWICPFFRHWTSCKILFEGWLNGFVQIGGNQFSSEK